MAKFTEFELSAPIMKAIADMGFEEATPIQERAMPLIMEGKDLIGQAQTGTGKTAAFGIPMLEDIDIENPSIQALIVAPTRELVVQVAEELNRLGQHKGVVSVAIYGGQDIERQIRALHKRPQIITATPGRLMDHMRRRTIRLDHVEMVVLDEADEMLNMGFLEDIEIILAALPAERQTLLFSATIPDAIRQLATRFMRAPISVSVQNKGLTVANIDQYYVEVPEPNKFDALCRLLDMQVPELAMVFGRTKRRVDELMMALSTRGYSAEGIHGDMTQSRRDTVMRKFRTGSIDVLVATDVAARGLDITGVTHVYNFDVPQDPEWYVHRIGRTGRAGKSGIAVTFVTPREIGYLHQLERLINRRIERLPVPTLTDAVEGQMRSAADNLQRAIAEGGLERFLPWAEELMAETDSTTLLAAALKVMTREPDVTPIELTSESPVRTRRDYPDRRGPGTGRPSGPDSRTRNFSGDRRPAPGGPRNNYGRRDDGPRNNERPQRKDW